MKHVTSYNLFESESEPIRTVFTKEQLNWLDECAENSWKYNPQTGLINVDGGFDCNGQGLTDFKGVRFGKVGVDFICSDNVLTTLEGAPQTVGGHFGCYDNQLTTLEGAPQTVGESFNCEDNELTTLVGAPQTVGVSFLCYRNELTTLVGAPKTVNGGFYCHDNPVTESTLKAIFALMEKGNSYQQALEEYWPEMGDEDRVLMYKQMPDLSPEDIRKYKALATYNNIKGYL